MTAPSKQQLRAHMHTLLRSLPAEALALASEKITAQLKASIPVSSTVATFASLQTEPNLSSLHQRNDLTLCYPLITGDSSMTFHHVSDEDSLVAGPFGIRQPNPSFHPEIPLEKIDIILCPGFAFTPDGQRLGKGGGFYDRALAHFSGETLGICFPEQCVDTVPTDPHDKPVDRVMC